jgi:FixJ family two-component response regulator
VTAALQICVIDDDESLRVALVGLLRSVGYVGQGFASAEDFLASGALQHVACVITDLQMPGMSGIDLKYELVARHCLVPVIMITARIDVVLEAKARASGARCFLKKPFDARELVTCIEKALTT